MENLTRGAAMWNWSGIWVGSWKPSGPISQSAHVKYFIPSDDLLNYESYDMSNIKMTSYLNPILSKVNMSSTVNQIFISSSFLSVVNA